jgi:hypothetical protein
MSLTRTRTVFAALAAAAAISAVGATGAMAAPKTGAAAQIPTQSQAAQTALPGKTGPRLPSVGGPTVAGVSAAPTGDTDVTEERCNEFADEINGLAQNAAAPHNTLEDVDHWLSSAQEAEDEALEAGCFIVYD